MTDATNRKLDVKNTDSGEIARDDPLFELSQIIGFSNSVEAPQSHSMNEEDQIDLEQELLRELEDYPGFSDDSRDAPAEYAEVAAEQEDRPQEFAPPSDTDPMPGAAETELYAADPDYPEPPPAYPVYDEPKFDYAPEPEREPEIQPEPEPAYEPEPPRSFESYVQAVSATRVEGTSAASEPGAPSADTLENELLELLGGLGDKAGAPWKPEAKSIEPQVPASAPYWYEEDQAVEEPESQIQQEPEPEVEFVRTPAPEPRMSADDDSAILDAFESELSEGLSISFEEMSDLENATARHETAATGPQPGDFDDAGDALDQGFYGMMAGAAGHYDAPTNDQPEPDDLASASIEEELDLDRAFEDYADAVEDAALDEIEFVAQEISGGTGSRQPPVLNTAELPAADMETMSPLDLPELPTVEEHSVSQSDIERELDAVVTGFDRYDERSARGPHYAQRPVYTAAHAPEPDNEFDLGELEDDLARDLEFVDHDMSAREDDADFGDLDEGELHGMAVPPVEERKKPKRGMLIAAAVGGIAILGAIGAFSLTGGNSGDDAGPVLVKADPDPIKVVPEDPGGKQVPNQDRAVYGEVDGNGGTAPRQETLVSTSEEPIDLGGTSAPMLPSAVTETGKVEDRLQPESEDTAISNASGGQAVLEPRRVRTVVVKPDGSFMPTPAAEPETGMASATDDSDSGNAAVRTIDTSQAPAQVETEAAMPAQQGVSPAESDALQKLASASSQSLQEQAATGAGEAATTVGRQILTPASIPERPTDQPVAVANTEPAPKAQTRTPAPAAQSSGYTVQISSQPSAALAQSSATELSRRYANLLSGRAITIQQAEIEGRGTFHRVRVAASDRQDAIALCEELKRAGGNCFVSR